MALTVSRLFWHLLGKLHFQPLTVSQTVKAICNALPSSIPKLNHWYKGHSRFTILSSDLLQELRQQFLISLSSKRCHWQFWHHVGIGKVNLRFEKSGLGAAIAVWLRLSLTPKRNHHRFSFFWFTASTHFLYIRIACGSLRHSSAGQPCHCDRCVSKAFSQKQIADILCYLY